jgi:N-carbamoyl-L-amino-acid hydrolase
MSEASEFLKVNGDRLWSRLMAMAKVGATAAGGCSRQALGDLDMAGRMLFKGWALEAGCEIREDAVGNVFARRAGSDDSLPVVMTGSHLDTQPTGGKFDGVYGVLAGLEVIESLNDRGLRTRHPLEVCVWCNEEGSRFPHAMMGSSVWAGKLPLAAARRLTDRDGISVDAELERLGFPADMVPRSAVKAALEAHIEQGPILEQQSKTIGVVTGVQHMSRHEVLVHGREAHAGPTPMDARKDPVRALADLLPALYGMTAEHGPEARLTIGFIETRPGSANTVPGLLRFTVDLRHPEADHYAALTAGLRDLVTNTLQKHGLEGGTRCLWEAPGVSFDRTCISAVRDAVRALGYEAMEMVSGAGHDSCNVSDVAPTAMIFVPCAGGLSHNEAESATPRDLEAGANVLLLALLALAA